MSDTLREALKRIAKPKYGLQGIMEDYSDTNAFNYHAMKYWRDLTQSYEATARAALAAAPQPAVEREALEGPPHDALTVALFKDAEGALTSYQCVKVAEKLLARGLRLPGEETMAWAVVGEDGKPRPHMIFSDQLEARRANAYAVLARVAIRVVEGGDE